MAERIWEQEDAEIKTMTVDEVYRALQSMGVKTTPLKIRAAISQGVYPFGICINMENREFEIYETLFEKWVSERVS